LILSLKQQIDSLTPDFTNTELIQYFKDIALGYEYGDSSEITRRWERDINLFLGGDISEDNLNEINKIKDEINELITTDVSLNIVTESINSNHYLYIGLREEYNLIFPNATVNDNNSGYFWVYWADNKLYDAKIFIDSQVSLTSQKHLIREELTQSLGLGKDSYTYPESIFQQDWTSTTEYAEIDKELIKLLYHPDMSTGLNASEVESVILEILN
jgi:hypothetical protein